MNIFMEWVLNIGLIILPLACLIKLCVTYLFNLKKKKESETNEETDKKTDSN